MIAGVRVHRDERDRVPVEHVANQRANAAVADNDDAGRLAVRRDLRAPSRRRAPRGAEPMRAPSFARPGITSIDIATALMSVVASVRSMRPPASAAPIITKPNSPPGPSRSDVSAAARGGRRNARPSPNSVRRLHRHQRRGETKNEAGPRGDERGIDRGADRDEVEPEQEAPERFDRHFDLAAIFGLRQQKPGDEGAERHRQMARRGGEPVAEHHQQARRHEELGALRFRDEMEERPQRQPAEDDQGGQDKRRRNERGQELPREAAVARGRQRAGHDEQRRDREILKQQHRQTCAAGARMKPFALDQHRNDDRGRRHGQRRPDRERRRRAKAEAPGGGGENQRRHDDLREAQPEHQMAHAPEPLERQLEPHGEHERDDAKGGDPVDRLDIDRKRAQPRRLLRDRAEAIGSKRDAGEQVAQHRTDAQPEEQRRDHARRHQEQQRLLVDRKVDRLVHSGLVAAARS